MNIHLNKLQAAAEAAPPGKIGIDETNSEVIDAGPLAFGEAIHRAFARGAACSPSVVAQFVTLK